MNLRRSSLIAVPLLAVCAVLAILAALGTTSRANAQLPGTLDLDMDPTNGSSPCNPIDDTLGASVGDTFQVAVCLTDSTVPTYSFNIDVLYDDTIDECVPVDCPGSVGCTDTNPDANAGSTTWTTPSLGADCDCSLGGELPPQCDRNPDKGPGSGQASINCYCGTPTLPVGEGVSSAVAMITFKRVEQGQDAINLGVAALYEEWGENILRCPGDRCPGGVADSSESVSPTPPGETPPAGTTPGAEATPNPGAGPTATAAAATAIAQGTPVEALDQAATATTAAVATKSAGSAKTPTAKATAKTGSTGEESGGGSSGPSALLIVGIVIVAGIVVGGGGWFGYRRFRAR